MGNVLSLLQPKHERRQELKERILKNKYGVLDALAESIGGARSCPLLLGQKCVGSFCEFFMPFQNIEADGSKKDFWRCSFSETPLLLIELNQNIRELIDVIKNKKTQ